MKTVKGISDITGISVRTLHYYDEIGLLKPTAYSENGYRLYGDKALEMLQQILFFREFDMPLKKIKDIMDRPGFDRTTILRGQKKLLKLKREHLDRLICSIDDILRGDSKRRFEVFSKADVEEMYKIMLDNMEDVQKQSITEQYGSMEEFKENFIDSAGSKEAQRNYKKMVEWYSGKDQALKVMEHIAGNEVFEAYQKRGEKLYKRLAEARGKGVNAFEVKQIIGEMDFVTKQLYQMDDVTEMMLDLAELYRKNEKIVMYYDGQYGEGTSRFIGEAIEAFYK